jgi:hypothetical protein
MVTWGRTTVYWPEPYPVEAAAEDVPAAIPGNNADDTDDDSSLDLNMAVGAAGAAALALGVAGGPGILSDFGNQAMLISDDDLMDLGAGDDDASSDDWFDPSESSVGLTDPEELSALLGPQGRVPGKDRSFARTPHASAWGIMMDSALATAMSSFNFLSDSSSTSSEEQDVDMMFPAAAGVTAVAALAAGAASQVGTTATPLGVGVIDAPLLITPSVTEPLAVAASGGTDNLVFPLQALDSTP